MRTKIIQRIVAELQAQSRQDRATRDADLLAAFVTRRDEAAFADLVRIHGPMVLGVCRRILDHAQDAEDAFQAAFWVLARRANAVRPRAQVGNWLYGVAVRTALKARAVRRRRREHQVDAMPSSPASDRHHDPEVLALLDQEIERLPAKYRVAVVLCELEGRSRAEAAAQLGVPEGTLSSRLAYARRLLAKRLGSRGVVPVAGGAALALTEELSRAAVPHALFLRTVQAASATAPASAAVASLAKGVMAAMFLSKLKQVSVVLVLCGLVISGLAVGSRTLGVGAQAADAPAGKPAAQAPAAEAGPAAIAEPVAEAIAADPPARPAKDSILGTWRVLRIDVRHEGPASAGPRGFGGDGFAAPKGGGFPMGGGPMGDMPSMPGGFAGFDGEQGRAFLYIEKDRARFTGSGDRVAYWRAGHLKLGQGTIDWQAEDTLELRRGIYHLEGDRLQLYFGSPANDPQVKATRPADPKQAVETWTLVRPPTRQEVYKKLDGLQGSWIARTGEYNGEALLPRELKGVTLDIRGDKWNMTRPSQPAQPDAVPTYGFAGSYNFILDSEGPRTLMLLHPQQGGPSSSEIAVLYDLRGDELKVCWNMNRRTSVPKDFTTTPGSERILFMLSRDKGNEPVQGAGSLPGAANPGGGSAPPPQAEPDKNRPGKLTLQVYAIPDLAGRDAGKEGTSLIQIIMRTIEPASWEGGGGSGSIEYFAEGSCLIVNQTPEIQERIQLLLDAVRKAKKASEDRGASS